MLYIYEHHDWPTLHWRDDRIAQPLAAIRHRQGRLLGRMQALGFPLRSEAVLHALTEDVVMSSEIEGEILDRQQVRSSPSGWTLPGWFRPIAASRVSLR